MVGQKVTTLAGASLTRVASDAVDVQTWQVAMRQRGSDNSLFVQETETDGSAVCGENAHIDIFGQYGQQTRSRTGHTFVTLRWTRAAPSDTV